MSCVVILRAARASAWGGVVLGALFVAGAVHAQAAPVDSPDTGASRQVVEDAARSRCDGVSVVVRRCVAPPAASPPGQDDDALTRSRVRAKAAFDRRDRRARQDALEGNDDAGGSDGARSAAHGKAQRLAPVIVTGATDSPPPSIEEILQRALNPQVVSPNGTVTTYGADGTRTECIAHCVGPMCCVTLRNRPDPARDSNSIGR